MPKPTKGPRLGGSSSHQKALLANLATSLFEHGRIKTTEPKARALRPYAEKLITHAKKGTLHNRREVMKKIRDKDVVHTLFAEIGPFFADRAGGYTRIIKVEARKGDNAPMAVIELVREKTVTSEANRARKSAGAAKKAAPVAAAAAPQAAVEPEAAEGPDAEETSVEEVKAEDEAIADAQTAEASDEAWPRKRRLRPKSRMRRPTRPTPMRMPTSPSDMNNEPAIESGGGLVRLRLDIAYDGTEFAGWAAQAGQRTVAGVLDEALSTVFRTPVAAARGRTHRHRRARHRSGGSRRRACRCDSARLPAHPSPRRPRVPAAGATAVAPLAVRCPGARDRPCASGIRRTLLGVAAPLRSTGCRPRRTASSRSRPGTSRRGRARSTSTRWRPRRENWSGCTTSPRSAGTARVPPRSGTCNGWTGRRSGDLITAHVTADAFCWSMVRSLVGALLAVGEGRREPAWCASLLTESRRSSDFAAAPAAGLTLVGVDYPPDDQLEARIAVTRDLRRID